MATTIFRNKNNVRPKKTGTKKRQRINVHRKRVQDLGVPAEMAAGMNPKELRTLLRTPVETAKVFSELAD